MRWLLLSGLLLTLSANASPPRFTEEREAAARHFVKRHCAELLPLLDELQKVHREQYERQIGEIFQTSELLAEMREHERRYEIELRIWKTQNRAFVVVARLARAAIEDRKRLEEQLEQLARDLVDLEVRSLEVQVEDLEAELSDAKAELDKAREQHDRRVKDRLTALLEQVRKWRK